MPLPTRSLGRNGPQVISMGAGLMSLGHAYGHAGTDEERLTYLDELYAMGETNWDGADIYGDQEEVVGKWFERTGKRGEIFLSTKFAFTDVTTGAVSSSAEYAREAIEKSLKRLKTDYVDLYYCHRVDGKTPIEETVKAMEELKKAGKIKYIGLSEVSAQTLRRACAVTTISAVQTEYSPFALDVEYPETALLKTCQELGVALVAYSPLGRGFLTGQIKTPADVAGDWRGHLPKFSAENFPKNLALVDEVKSIAEKRGVTPSQLVLAWLLAQWDMVIPIPGTRRVSAMRENLEALNLTLSAREMEEIRDVSVRAGVFGERYPAALMQQLFADTPEL